MSQQVSFFMEITSSLMSILEPTCFIVYQLHIDLAMHCLNMFARSPNLGSTRYLYVYI